MEQKLGESRKLEKSEEAAEAAFRDVGPCLFNSEGAKSE
jgi:hypothetical protein